MSINPHGDGLVKSFGAPLKDAAGVVILLHGRGASAENILSLAPLLSLPQLAFLAPEAVGNTWYPNSFLAPISQNQPWLYSALRKVEDILEIATDAGITPAQVVIAGFSQGACLSTEFVATHPQRYAGMIAFTGGLIGPPETDLSYKGDLSGTPALFASGDPDPHVPWQRVQQSADILAGMGASVEIHRYPGRSHTVSSEEVELAKNLIHRAFSQPPPK